MVRRALEYHQNLPLPSQLPDLNIIEPLWGVLEQRIWSRFEFPISMKLLADVLVQEWDNIPLETILRRVIVTPQANGVPT